MLPRKSFILVKFLTLFSGHFKLRKWLRMLHTSDRCAELEGGTSGFTSERADIVRALRIWLDPAALMCLNGARLHCKGDTCGMIRAVAVPHVVSGVIWGEGNFSTVEIGSEGPQTL